jgi:manganese/zinc-transporting P-type ATPase C
VSWQIVHATRGRLRFQARPPLSPRELGRVAERLGAIVGVTEVSPRARTGSLVVRCDPAAELAVRTAIGAEPRGPRNGPLKAIGPPPPRARVIPAPPSASGTRVLGAAAAIGMSTLPVPGSLLAALVVASGLPLLFRAGRTIAVERRLTAETLDAVALVLLLGRQSYGAAGLLTGLLALGQWILEQSVTATRRSVRELFGPPDQVVRRIDGRRRHTVAATKIRKGEVILVGAGERVPVDGRVVRGEALVDQHTMTGESLPVERRARDHVYAGTTIEDGEVAVRAEQVGADTRLGRIIRAIEAAEGEKAELQVVGEALADRLASRTFLLAGAGALTARSLDASIAILVADYGQAVRVAIPTAAMVAIRRGVDRGMLLKGPRVLERLARVDTVVFDKTGTLTWGMPHVSRVASLDPRLPVERVLGLAAAAEREVRHPVARAIVRHATRKGVPIPAGSARESRVGLGTVITIEGIQVLVGGRRFMESQSVPLQAGAAEEAAAHAAGASPTFVGVGGKLKGILVLEDALRDDARDAIEALRARRVREIVMVSGDHPEPTRRIAERLAIRRWHAEFLPEDKAALIQALRAEGRVVAMVGDGVNDALALQAADVGIAVQGGAEVVTEAARVVLLRPGLDRVVRALDLGRDTVRTFGRTMEIATRGNVAAAGLASFGLVGPVGAILLSHGASLGAALYALGLPAPRHARSAGPAGRARPALRIVSGM